MRLTFRPSGTRTGKRSLTAVAACVAWFLAVLVCPGFGQALAQDEPSDAHYVVGESTVGHADTDLCCKALGDTSTLMRAVAMLAPDLAQSPAPVIVAPASPVAELFIVQPLDRPPLDDRVRRRTVRFVAFWSHAPPAFHI